MAVDVAETVPEAPGVVVTAEAVAAPPLPAMPFGLTLSVLAPPAPPVAVETLEALPEAPVAVVVADAFAAPPLPPLLAPLPPAPPVANAEFVESVGLFAIAVAGAPGPPSPVVEFAPSSEPGTTGMMTVSANAGEIATNPMAATDKSSLAFISSSPHATADLADYARLVAKCPTRARRGLEAPPILPL
jgi:hypothetical protein